MKIRTCVFPVGGLGKRFLPATKSIPKEMLVVIDKPLIQYAVEEAMAAGIERFIFITAQGKSAIEDHFDGTYRLPQEFCYQGLCFKPGQAIYIRQSEPLGLGHAILCAKKWLDEDLFAVILADDLIFSNMPCLTQMQEVYNQQDGNMVAATLVSREQTHLYGMLLHQDLDGKKIRASKVIEKPVNFEASQTAIVGRYILNRRILDCLEEQRPLRGEELQLTDALAKMIPDLGLSGYFYEGQRFDCGMKAGWLSANMALAYANPELRLALQKTWNQLNTHNQK